MKSDPATYIYFATVLGFCIGFFACALMASRRIRQAEMHGWRDAVRFYQTRDKEARETPRL